MATRTRFSTALKRVPHTWKTYRGKEQPARAVFLEDSDKHLSTGQNTSGISEITQLMSEEVVFYIPDGRSVPYRFERDLPLRARLVGSESGFLIGTEIEILQAEVGDTGMS